MESQDAALVRARDRAVIHNAAINSSAGRLRAPRVLRQTPVDPFQQISQLRRRDRHRPIRIFARNGRWPDEAASLQPRRIQAHPLAVVPQDLDQAAAPATEYEQMAVMGIALERLLHQQRQAIESLALMWSST